MLDSPFPYQGPLPPDQVTGRDDLLADLVEAVTAHRLTALLGPRRFGKTSVLKRLASDLEAAGTTVIWLDLYAVRSFADLAVRLDNALAGTGGPHRARLDQLAASAELNLGLIRAKLTRPDRPLAEPTVDAMLDVLVSFAADHPTLLVLDEFSAIAGVDGATGLLRTKLQHHYGQIGIVFAGSEPSTMRTLFEHVEQPFYAQADLVRIGPLSTNAIAGLVADGWGGTPPPGLAGRIADFTRGHPQRVMQLADAAYRLAPDGSASDDSLWAEALDDVRSRTDAGFEVRFAGMGSADQAALRIVANGESLFGRHAELLALSASSAQNARCRLVASGAMADDDGLEVVDPLLADWLRRRFPI